jgi:hypothetical protein
MRSGRTAGQNGPPSADESRQLPICISTSDFTRMERSHQAPPTDQADYFISDHLAKWQNHPHPESKSNDP